MSPRERGKGKVGREERKREPSRREKGQKSRRLEAEDGVMKQVLKV